MAEKAGELYVDITARTKSLEQGLQQIKQTVPAAGKDSGNFFATKFAEQSRGVMGTLVGPMMAASLAKGAADVLRSDKALPDAILDALKTIPFIGAFADLGSAIYDATFGAADKAAADLQAQAEKARDSMRRVALERQKEQNVADASTAGFMREAERLKLEQEINAVRRTGDEEAIARKERQMVKDRLDVELQFKMAEGITDAELNALVDVNREKLRQADFELETRLKAIETEKQAKQKAAEELKQREAEQQQRQREAAENDVRLLRLRVREQKAANEGDVEGQKRIANEREKVEQTIAKEKALREALTSEERRAIEQRFALEEELGALQEKSQDAQQRAANATGTASTALGSFTFDAFPKEQQKAVSERTAKAVEAIAASPLVTTPGGFM